MFTGGTNVLQLQAGSSITGNAVAFSTADTFALGGTTDASFDVSQIGSQYLGFGIYEKTGTSTWTLTNTTTAMTPWTINQGTLAVSADANLGAASGGLTFGGGTLRFLSGFTSARTITLNAGGGTFDTDGNSPTLSGAIGGTGSLTVANSGVGGSLTLTNSGNNYSGSTTVDSGATLALSGAGTIASSSGLADNGTFDISGLGSGTSIVSLSGAGAVTLGANTLTLSNASGTFSGAIGGAGGLTLTTGSETLSGTNGYLGATTINGGTLVVNGSIADLILTTVASGATLDGIGTIGDTQIDGGGTLAPGSGGPSGTLTVGGNLGFNSGSFYGIQIAPGAGNNSKTVVNGTATLGGNGTVVVTPQFGHYNATVYQILTTPAPVDLTGTFAGLTINGNFTGTATLDYATNPGDVDLDISGTTLFITPAGANQNSAKRAQRPQQCADCRRRHTLQLPKSRQSSRPRLAECAHAACRRGRHRRAEERIPVDAGFSQYAARSVVGRAGRR